jgi:hypothetical protein
MTLGIRAKTDVKKFSGIGGLFDVKWWGVHGESYVGKKG